MKRLLFLLLLPAFSFAQTGSISGNAFYHYNDYVGDKPEAGATVYLFADSVHPGSSTQCDVQGNYRFDKVKPGQYLLMVVSYNTYDDGYFILSELKSQQGRYRRFLGFDIGDLGQCYDSIAILDTALTRAMEKKLSAKKSMQAMDAGLKAIHDQTRRAVDEAYHRTSFYPKLAMGGLLHKIYFSIVSVDVDENKTVISNFGISS